MFNDLKVKKLRKAGEVFEVSDKRAAELSTAHNGTLIEIIDEPRKESGEANVGKSKTSTKNKK